jgi:hypothetical protein
MQVRWAASPETERRKMSYSMLLSNLRAVRRDLENTMRRLDTLLEEIERHAIQLRLQWTWLRHPPNVVVSFMKALVSCAGIAIVRHATKAKPLGRPRRRKV